MQKIVLFFIVLFIVVSLAFFILRVHIAANKISSNCAYLFLMMTSTNRNILDIALHNIALSNTIDKQ